MVARKKPGLAVLQAPKPKKSLKKVPRGSKKFREAPRGAKREPESQKVARGSERFREVPRGAKREPKKPVKKAAKKLPLKPKAKAKKPVKKAAKKLPLKPKAKAKKPVKKAAKKLPLKPKAKAKKPAAVQRSFQLSASSVQRPTSNVPRVWRLTKGAVPPKVARPRRQAVAREALLEFGRALGLPQEYEPRRPPPKLIEAPNWELGKKYARTWKGLAQALHVTLSELTRWRKGLGGETARARLAQYIELAERSLKHTQDDIRTFNRLRKLAGDNDFYPSYQDQVGRRNGPRTIGIFWTRSIGAAPDTFVIDDIMNWFDSLKGRSEYDLWHATGMVLQYGGLSSRRASSKVSLAMAGNMPKEAADFSGGYISNVPVGPKSYVMDALRFELEAFLEEDALTVIDWITVRNYRKKTAEEISDYNFSKRLEQKKRAEKAEPEAMRHFKISMGIGARKRVKKAPRGSERSREVPRGSRREPK